MKKKYYPEVQPTPQVSKLTLLYTGRPYMHEDGGDFFMLGLSNWTLKVQWISKRFKEKG